MSSAPVSSSPLARCAIVSDLGKKNIMRIQSQSRRWNVFCRGRSGMFNNLWRIRVGCLILDFFHSRSHWCIALCRWMTGKLTTRTIIRRLSLDLHLSFLVRPTLGLAAEDIKERKACQGKDDRWEEKIMVWRRGSPKEKRQRSGTKHAYSIFYIFRCWCFTVFQHGSSLLAKHLQC